MRVWGGLLAALGYVLGAHWLMTQAPHSVWTLTLLLAPMACAMALVARRSLQRLRNSIGLALVMVAGAAVVWHLDVSAPLLYLAQHVGTQLFLAAWFWSSLRPGSQPLISRWAALVHPLTPGKRVYTRKLTAVWVAYFVGMAGLSMLLYASVDFETWALFANLGTPITLAIMLLGEYWLRYQLHPEFERTSLRAAWQAYKKS